tara:strand:- start:100 stop:396 length:297 start_codon:yes stop_codon:yes gene_type:complete
MIDQVLNPRISIIITCYNYGKFIEDAVSSVIRQTFSDYEVIIIDDCSTDQFTIGKIKELHQLYENNNKFNLILLPKNIDKKIINNNITIFNINIFNQC